MTAPRCKGFARNGTLCLNRPEECAVSYPTDMYDVAQACLANSKRWFPDPHNRGLEHAILHMALGVAGEAGEVVELVKKAHRFGETEQINRKKLGDELIDVIVYCLNLCALLDIDPEIALRDKTHECEQRYQRRLAGLPEKPSDAARGA